MKIKGLVLGALTIIIWGITFVNTKALLNDFNSFEILFVRFLAAYAALWIIHPHRFKVEGWREELNFAGMGLFGVAAYQFLENVAISHTNASNVAILVSACPMGAAILSRIFLKERSLTRRFVVGFVLAICGVALVCLGGIRAFHFRPTGDVLAFCAMGCWSAYSVLITRTNRKGYGPVVAIRRTFFWSLAFMLPFLPFGCSFDPAANAARFAKGINLLNFGFLGFLASALAFVLWNETCKVLGTVRATCGLYFIPVVTAAVAHFALGESLTAMTGLGAVLTILGVVICG